MSVQVTEGRTVNINEAKRIVLKAFRKQRPIMLWGAPGIGKSDLVDQIATELNRDLIDIRLPLWEPTDIKGMPYYNAKTGNMEWSVPAEFPTDPKSTAIIFLDELNGAAPSVQAAAYQLILNRRVGQYVLPKNVLIIAAGNRETDKGVTYRMPKPLANRFVHLELRVDFEVWRDWAIENQIHPDVVGYLSFQKKDLYDFNPQADSRSFATPRSWSFVSELMYDDQEDVLEQHLETDMVSGCVGEGVAIKFQTHRNMRSNLPNPSDILTGKVTEVEGDIESSGQYALTTGMCYELKEAFEPMKTKGKHKEWHEMAENFLGFMMANFSTEMVIFGARTALKNYKLPFDHTKMKNFGDFFDKYGKLIIDA